MKCFSLSSCVGLLAVGFLAMVLGACETTPTATKPTVTPAATKPTVTPPVAGRVAIRVNAGGDQVTDKKGNVWAASMGFEGGTALPRPELVVAGAEVPEVARDEQYGMDSWSTKLPNGKYLLRLHFSENYDGNSDENARLFNYTVKDGDANGTTLKAVTNFSPWKAAKARATEYIDELKIEITKGQLTITFQTLADNSQIDGIEVIPQ
jgi:hypothetical protein